MSHKHVHGCTHENIKYCKHCDTVYCTNCDREWPQKTYYNYTYNPYYGQQYLSGGISSVYCGGAGGDTKITSGQLSVTNSSCSHSNS